MSDDIFAEAERMARAEADRLDAYNARPDVAARMAARKQAQFESEIRQGLRDIEGNWIDQPDEDAEDDTDEEDA